MTLNAKQLAFLDAYRESFDVVPAAKVSQLRLDGSLPKAGYYVYLLCDPATGAIFYVGKGKGQRAMQHEKAVARGASSNGAKDLAISKIREAGECVNIVVFHRTASEPDAYEVERLLIRGLRDFGLTNIANGVVHPMTASLAKCRWMLSRVMNRDKYISLYGAERGVLYDWLVSSLRVNIHWLEFKLGQASPC